MVDQIGTFFELPYPKILRNSSLPVSSKLCGFHTWHHEGSKIARANPRRTETRVVLQI